MSGGRRPPPSCSHIHVSQKDEVRLVKSAIQHTQLISFQTVDALARARATPSINLKAVVRADRGAECALVAAARLTAKLL